MKQLIILFLISFIFISCNTDNNDNKGSTTKKTIPSQTLKNSEKIGQVEGKWYGTGMTRKVVVTKLSSKSFEFHSYYGDGSDKKETTTLNSSNEYHTYNRFGEYYKVSNSRLGSYDKQGFIESYSR